MYWEIGSHHLQRKFKHNVRYLEAHVGHLIEEAAFQLSRVENLNLEDKVGHGEQQALAGRINTQLRSEPS